MQISMRSELRRQRRILKRLFLPETLQIMWSDSLLGYNVVCYYIKIMHECTCNRFYFTYLMYLMFQNCVCTFDLNQQGKCTALHSNLQLQTVKRNSTDTSTSANSNQAITVNK